MVETALWKEKKGLGFWKPRSLDTVGLMALEASDPNPIAVDDTSRFRFCCFQKLCEPRREREGCVALRHWKRRLFPKKWKKEEAHLRPICILEPK